MDSQRETPNTLSGRDLAIGTVIALLMATAFTTLSSGRSLLVTFVPGVVFAWAVTAWIYARQIPLPRTDAFVPLFFATLGVQFVHFGEEYLSGFRTFFPSLYGGAAYANDLFVVFNMASYAIFTSACLLVFYGGLRFFLIPVLFFVIYGAIGNAISHTWWVLDAEAYRPGFFTAQVYWIAGPWLLYRLLGSRVQVAAVMVLFGGVLVTLLSLYAGEMK
jgi:hypothetical protein